MISRQYETSTFQVDISRQERIATTIKIVMIPVIEIPPRMFIEQQCRSNTGVTEKKPLVQNILRYKTP